MLLPEMARVGDYVLVHAGFAIQKIDEAVALDSMNLIREYAEALEDYEEHMPEQPRSIFEA
jgi:hydrogenase expression/formation protein HypC